MRRFFLFFFFFFQAEDGIRDLTVTGVQTCALPICARLIAAPNTGWDSVVLAPAMKMTSAACSTSRIEPEAAEVLSARCIAATEVEWHSRVQWSMLLVPSAPRNSRMRR